MASKKKSGRGSLSTILIVTSVVLFAVGGLATWRYFDETERINQENLLMQETVGDENFYEGIYINDIALGGLSFDEAKQLIKKDNEGKLALMNLSLRYENKVWQVTAGDMQVTYTLDEVLSQAYAVGRQGTLKERYDIVEELKTQPKRYYTDYTFKENAAQSTINLIKAELDQPPVEPVYQGFDQEAKAFAFTQEVIGQTVKAQELISRINKCYADGDFSSEIIVEVTPQEPMVTKAQLETQYGLLSHFETKTTSNSARNSNIRLISEKINGIVLLPGEEFSANAASGPRNEKTGYKPAGAIKNGILIEEPGGGVCQASGTLANAVVRVDGLRVTNRRPHSWPSDYLTPGEDAAIDYPSLDFKFVNDTEAPIVILMHYADRKVSADIYGLIKDPTVTYDLKTVLIEKTDEPVSIYRPDPTIPLGETVEYRKGRTGYKYETYRQKYVNGELVEGSDVLLWTSIYKETAAIYLVGEAVEPTATDQVEGDATAAPPGTN